MQFSENKINIKISNLSDSKTRSSISEISNRDFLFVNKDGKKKIYHIDLDKLGDYDQGL